MDEQTMTMLRMAAAAASRIQHGNGYGKRKGRRDLDLFSSGAAYRLHGPFAPVGAMKVAFVAAAYRSGAAPRSYTPQWYDWTQKVIEEALAAVDSLSS